MSRIHRFRLASALGVIAAAPFVIVSCSAASKATVEERLLSLPKNARWSSDGFRSRSMTMEVDGAERTLEVRYLFQPALARREGALPVVLVHGTPGTALSWVEVMLGAEDGESFAGLSAERDVYALEVAGHGIARDAVGPYTFQRCADYVAAALRTLALERVHLVGHSYGGEFVWRAALDAPELIASLVLIDSSGYPRPAGGFLPEEVQMRENRFAKLGYLLNSRERITTALAPHFDEIPPGRVDELFWVCENAANWRAMVELARDENGLRAPELVELQPPTLILWGESDFAYSVQEYAARFDRDIPRSELRVMPGAGHYPHEQRPGSVVGILAETFDRNEAELAR